MKTKGARAVLDAIYADLARMDERARLAGDVVKRNPELSRDYAGDVRTIGAELQRLIRDELEPLLERRAPRVEERLAEIEERLTRLEGGAVLRLRREA